MNEKFAAILSKCKIKHNGYCIISNFIDKLFPTIKDLIKFSKVKE